MRLRAPSLLSALWTYVFTVLRVRPSASAISGFVSPMEMRRRMSYSRRVSAHCRSLRASCWLATPSSPPPAVVGIVSPAATRRTTPTRSARSASLSTTARAPAARAGSTAAWSAYAVKSTTLASGAPRRMPWITSGPSMSGRRRSSRTTSGWVCSATVIASRPVRAYPASVIHDVLSTRRRTPSSTIG